MSSRSNTMSSASSANTANSSANMSAINRRNVISNNNIIAEMQICQGSKGMYYCVNNVNFDIHFPLQYALDMTKDAVEFCVNCNKYGYVNGVFVGFCCGCIDTKYNSSNLGNGMEYYETQRVDETHTEYTTIWQTYLRGIDLDQIGDDELAEHMQESKVMSEPAAPLEPETNDESKFEAIHAAMMNGKITVRDGKITVLDGQNSVLDGQITIRDRIINTATICGNN